MAARASTYYDSSRLSDVLFVEGIKRADVRVTSALTSEVGPGGEVSLYLDIHDEQMIDDIIKSLESVRRAAKRNALEQEIRTLEAKFKASNRLVEETREALASVLERRNALADDINEAQAALTTYLQDERNP